MHQPLQPSEKSAAQTKSTAISASSIHFETYSPPWPHTEGGEDCFLSFLIGCLLFAVCVLNALLAGSPPIGKAVRNDSLTGTLTVMKDHGKP